MSILEKLEPRRLLAATPALSVSVEAVNYDENHALNNRRTIPPDPHAAAGPNHVITIVNNAIEWYTKSGARQYRQRLGRAFNGNAVGSFFAPLNPLDVPFDPKVIYDQYANRFIVVALEQLDTNDGDASNESRVLLAVSDDADPNGIWHYQAINAELNITGKDSWFDYPGLAIDEEAIYLTGNYFTYGAIRERMGSRLFILPKSPLYGGTPSAVNIYDAAQLAAPAFAASTTIMPAHMFGDAPAGLGTFLVRYNGFSNGTNEFLSVIRVDNPLASPTFTNQFVSVGDIDNVDASGTVPDIVDAPQKDSPILIETNDRRALTAVWRDNALYTATTLLPPSGPDAGQTTAHWFKVYTSNLSSLRLADQGNIGGEEIAPGTHTFFPQIAVSENGTIAVGFSASASSIHPGAYYAARLATDPEGTMRAPAVLAEGVDFYNRTSGELTNGTRNRWGDYTGMVIDPSDPNTFWVYNQYARPRGNINPLFPTQDGRWGTRLGSFTLAPDLGRIEGLNFDEAGHQSNLFAAQHYANVAAGPNHLVSVVRSSIEWHAKSGAQQFSKSLVSFFTPLAPLVTSLTEPRVIFDTYSNRFVVMAVEQLFGASPSSRVLLAASDDADPNGNWHYFAINTRLTLGGSDSYADLPQLAVDDKAIYLSPNYFAFTGGAFTGARVIIVNKSALYSGGAPAVTFHDVAALIGGTFFDFYPAMMHGTPPAGMGAFFLRYNGANTGGVENLDVIRVTDPLTAPTFTRQTISLGNIDDTAASIPDAPQLGSAIGIETFGRRIYGAVWRDNALYAATQVMPTSGANVGQVTAHWFKFNTTNPAAIFVADQGDAGGEDIAAGTHTFYPAIAVDSAGGMALSFSASSASKYVGAYFARRLAGDAPGTIGASGIVAEGTDYFVRRFGGSTNFWGLQSGLALDPADGLTFWAHNAYAIARGTLLAGSTDDGRWATRIASFFAQETPLTVTIDPVSPNPRKTPLSQVALAFDQIVSGFDISDLTLRRNGGANLLTASQSLISANGRNFTLGDLSSLTSVNGNYVLAFNAAHGIAGPGGKPLVNTPSVSFTVDVTPPAFNLWGLELDTPGIPHRLRILFTENVSASLSPADFSIVRQPGNVPVVADSDIQYELSTNSAFLTFTSLPGARLPDGNYRVTVIAAGITDAAGNVMANNRILDFRILQGDANNDGVVDHQDFAVLHQFFGQPIRAFSQGDFNGSGVIDFGDFQILERSFGNSVPSPAPSPQAARKPVFQANKPIVRPAPAKRPLR